MALLLVALGKIPSGLQEEEAKGKGHNIGFQL